VFIGVDHPQLLVTLNKHEEIGEQFGDEGDVQSGDDGDVQIRDIDSESDGSEVSEATQADSEALPNILVPKETGGV
jgi:hypothetical protein